MSHHWIENTDFGDPGERIENNSTTHVCKHCDAMGDVCYECDGEGETEDSEPCPECDGEGVVFVAGVSE
jgi:DnaJ-class molecular chaperone